MLRSLLVKYRSLLVILVLSISACVPTESDPGSFGPEFGEEVSRIMAHWLAPGTVMSIVKDGEVLFIGGFGLTRPGGDQIPNGQTITPIQSVTKPITSLAIGMLVDEGLVSWDEPIQSYIPEFSCGDPLASEQMNLRDLLSHNELSLYFL